jgi:hypothetical protein
MDIPRIRPAGQLDPTRLAAASGVHLGLHHHRSGEPLRNGPGFFGRGGDIAVGHRDPRRAQQYAGLVFVEVQAGLFARMSAISRQPSAFSD